MNKIEKEYVAQMNELKYLMELYPISIAFRDNGKHVAWAEGEGWCFYIDGEERYMLCENFHHAMQKLVEPD